MRIEGRATIMEAMRGDKGFTLIETVFSLALILIAVVGLFAIVTTSTSPSSSTPQYSEIAAGTLYVQEKLEKILADKRNPSIGFSNITGTSYDDESLSGDYKRTTSVTAWPDSSSVTYKKITVQVTHRGMMVADGVLLLASYP